MNPAAKGVWSLCILIVVVLMLATAVPFLAHLFIELVQRGWEAGA